LSIVLGRASIFFWIWAQFPQIYTNWKLKSARSLSPKFLLYWWAGDITALIGCLLTNQLAFQRDMAIYSCVVDGILLFQYVYYTRRDRRRGHGHGLPASAGIPGGTTGLGLGFGDDSEADDPSDHTALGPLVSDSQVLLMSSSSLRTFSAPTTGLAPWQQQVGVVAAWFACACYISSRVPQIWRNAQRRSVQGLSMAMFVAAALGNATYALSLLLAGYDDPAVLVDSLPYLVGSSVPVFFDVVIYTQSVMYNK
ncbi:hypothetical protein CXG81DRAFT_4844, partial [Caulochytrium protostelioides]